jgi:hypothetical protein
MCLKRLPRDDLAVAKPIGPRALALVGDFTRLDPPDLGSPEPDHGVASCYEALREDARLHVLISRFKPIAHLVVTTQSRPPWGLEHNLAIVQREKLINVVAPIEELDPSARDCDILLRHCAAQYLCREPGLCLRGARTVHRSAALLLPRHPWQIKDAPSRRSRRCVLPELRRTCS